MKGMGASLVLLAAALVGGSAAALVCGSAAAQNSGGGAAAQRSQPASNLLVTSSSSSAAPSPSNAPDALLASRVENTPSDSELKTFVEIYTELQKAGQVFDREIGEAETAQDVRDIRLKRRQADDAALRKHGWTREEFKRMADALNEDPALVERAVRLFGRF